MPLAFMLASTHGLTEMANTLEEVLKTTEGVDIEALKAEVSKYALKSSAIQPLRPLHLADQASYAADWPMTNLRIQKAERAAQMFAKQNELKKDDKNFFESSEFASTNKDVSNIMQDKPADAEKKTQVVKAEAELPMDFGSDDDISLGSNEEPDATDANSGVVTEVANMSTGASGSQDNSHANFVPPSQGASLIHQVAKRHPLSAAI